ncbi:MAG: tagaturonate reductase [Bacteroidaceae bacterium]|nr:tagaturonate reductase [Bacteroidaceae bacterium]
MKSLNKHTAPKSCAPERIIQFGEGNFLRCFVDWIIYNMNQRTDFNSSVVIVQPIEHGMVDMLNGQDCMYHVNLQGRLNGEVVNSITRIDCVSRALNPYTQNAAFMALAEQPEMRFVISNTTEAGIAFDATCKLNDAPASSYPGKLTQLLYHRYTTFHGAQDKGLIILPCELIFLNGHHLKDCIYQYIELWKDDLGSNYEGFKKWFTECCYVCATLVDRIVPGFPRKDIADIQQRISYFDNMVVQGEAFHLWVIEKPENMSIEALKAEFPAEKAGLNVLISESEKPYHERKVTLLNGPHTVLSPVAFLSGINIVRDACNDEIISKYIHKVQFDELMQTLNLPMNELEQFAGDVLERFNNPYVDHQVTSIMLNSFPKYATRDLPGVKTYLERKGKLPTGLVFGLAAIIVYYKGGKRVDGTDIIPNDAPEIIELLKELWATNDTQKIAEGVLGATNIWNENLNLIPGLTSLLKTDLDEILSLGMKEAVLRKGI